VKVRRGAKRLRGQGGIRREKEREGGCVRDRREGRGAEAKGWVWWQSEGRGGKRGGRWGARGRKGNERATKDEEIEWWGTRRIAGSRG